MAKPTIRTIKEGIYDVYIRISGKRIRRRFSRRTCRGIDPKAAAEKFAEEMSNISRLYSNSRPTIEISTYFKAYLRWAEAEKSARTVERDRGRLKIFEEWARPKKILFLSDITPKCMDAFKAYYLKRRGRNPNNYISIVQAVLNRAVAEGLLPRNPLTGYKKVKVSKDEPLKFFSTAEVRRILKALPRPFPYDFFVVLLHTGMRIRELINLEIGSVDIERGLICVESRESHPTKTRKTRYVPITDESKSVIEGLLSGRRKEEKYLFDKGDGRPRYLYNWYCRYFKRLCETIDIPEEKRTLHTFRHTYATKLLSEGIKMYVVSDVLGHSDFRTTLRVYGHLDPEYRAPIKGLRF